MKNSAIFSSNAKIQKQDRTGGIMGQEQHSQEKIEQAESFFFEKGKHFKNIKPLLFEKHIDVFGNPNILIADRTQFQKSSERLSVAKIHNELSSDEKFKNNEI